jgi:hypothetical protein
MKVTPVCGKQTGKELPYKDIQLLHTRSKWKKRLPQKKRPKKNIPNHNVREKQKEWKEVLEDVFNSFPIMS